MARVEDCRARTCKMRYPKGRRSCRLSRAEVLAKRAMLLGCVGGAVLGLMGVVVVAILALKFLPSNSEAGGRLLTVVVFVAQLLLALAGVCVVVSGAYLVWPGRRSRVERAARLNDGVCGACEYALPSESNDPDGCVVCPECGAAWKLQTPGGVSGST